MTGAFLKNWARKQGFTPEALAEKLGISRGTVYMLFRSAVIDRKTILALAQIGCVNSIAHDHVSAKTGTDHS